MNKDTSNILYIQLLSAQPWIFFDRVVFRWKGLVTYVHHSGGRRYFQDIYRNVGDCQCDWRIHLRARQIIGKIRAIGHFNHILRFYGLIQILNNIR